MKFATGLLAFAIAMMSAAPSAHAADTRDVGLPSDFGPISIAASRRAVEADIQDWIDDKADIKNRRVLACALAGIEGALGTATLAAVSPLILIADLPEYLGSRGPTEDIASTPLTTPLERLASDVKLTDPEMRNLRRLMARSVGDRADRLRLYIDTESFLMKISARLYLDQMNDHLGRTTGVRGFFRADAEYCAAFTIQTERDEQLMQASSRVLAFYTFLEQELAD